MNFALIKEAFSTPEATLEHEPPKRTLEPRKRARPLIASEDARPLIAYPSLEPHIVSSDDDFIPLECTNIPDPSVKHRNSKDMGKYNVIIRSTFRCKCCMNIFSSKAMLVLHQRYVEKINKTHALYSGKKHRCIKCDFHTNFPLLLEAHRVKQIH